MYQMEKNTEALTVTLANGNQLGYAIYGNPNGYPIFYFHGFPGSRFEGKMFDQPMKESPFKIIAIDRPGIGLSSLQKDRSLLTWAENVLELADQLKILKFAVLGISGGGPYAWACAAKIPPNRLIACMVISGMGPMESAQKHMAFIARLGLWIARISPPLFRLISTHLFYYQFKTIDRSIKNTQKMIKSFSKEDKAIFTENSPFFEQYFVADNYYAYVQGVVGTAQDIELYARPWGFNLKSIPEKIPVFILHGEVDDLIPVPIGRYVASQIPHCKARFFSDGGHFSTSYRYMGTLLPELLTIFESKNHQ